MRNASFAALDALESRRLFDGSILFVRGADRSGGFLEATDDTGRTEQLADVRDASTARGNHGWAAFAETLRDAGYAVSQVVEPLESGAPATGQTDGAAIRFDRMRLAAYDAIVFASNNADYAKPQINAIDAYVRRGGAALFISDANFGSSWRDSADSDQQFLNRFGLAVNQDDGTYPLTRDADFAVDAHPIFRGVDAFDGEGVSPLRRVARVPGDTTVARLVGARGMTVENDGTGAGDDFRGTGRATDGRDAALITATAGSGRVAGFFDRNTFFNANGAGTDLTRFDNARLATNLFDWLTDDAVPGVASAGFSRSATRPTARVTFDESLAGSLTSADVRVRDRATGRLIARSSYVLGVVDADDATTLSVRFKSGVDAGPYRIEVRERGVRDAAGNERRSAVRFNFDLRR